MTFEELYRTMLKQAVERGSVQADDLEASAGHLDCLLHPQDHPLVWPLNPCTCPKEETHCAAACLFDAIVRRDDGTLAVDPDWSLTGTFTQRRISSSQAAAAPCGSA